MKKWDEVRINAWKRYIQNGENDLERYKKEKEKKEKEIKDLDWMIKHQNEVIQSLKDDLKKQGAL